MASLKTDPLKLAVSPDHFAEQLTALRQEFEPMTLKTFVSAKGGQSRPGVALTFDDGYGDNLRFARPLLERHEFPATVFVTSGYVGGAREFWWDELERTLVIPAALPPRLHLTIGGHDRAWDVSKSRHAPYRSLCVGLRGLTAKDREAVLESLRRWAGVEDQPRASHRPLTEDEVIELIKDGLVEIGAHTVHHPALALLPHSEQQDEIESSKHHLEQIVGKHVVHFSYPFGRGRRPRQTYSRRTLQLVERAGFSTACALRPSLRLRPSRYELPRMLVRDWSGEELLRRIDRHLRGYGFPSKRKVIESSRSDLPTQGGRP